MPAAFKRCFKPDLDDFKRQHITDHTPAHYQDICVVVPAAHGSGKRIATKRSPDMRKSIGHHGHPDTGAAHEYPPVKFPRSHRPRNPDAKIRVVDGIGVLRALVRDLVSLVKQIRFDRLLQKKSGMVAADDDSFRFRFLRIILLWVRNEYHPVGWK